MFKCGKKLKKGACSSPISMLSGHTSVQSHIYHCILLKEEGQGQSHFLSTAPSRIQTRDLQTQMQHVFEESIKTSELTKNRGQHYKTFKKCILYFLPNKLDRLLSETSTLAV